MDIILPADGFNTTTVYVTSDGLNGTLIIGTDNQFFVIEPTEIPLNPDDVNMPIEITIYGNATMTPGIYEEKLTFIGFTGDVVSMGIKIRANIELYEVEKEYRILGYGVYQVLGLTGLVFLASTILLNKQRSDKGEEENEYV